MKEIQLGKVLAERVLTSGKSNEDVKIKIGSPQKTANDDYITPYQIVGAGDEKVRFAAGMDSVQSLQLAFQMIGADIRYRLKEYEFRWADQDSCGFPVP